jgi:hypothetical protein
VVGAAFGYAIGREVARRQLKRLEKDRADDVAGTPAQLSLEQGSGPLFNSGPEGTRIGWVIVF